MKNKIIIIVIAISVLGLAISKTNLDLITDNFEKETVRENIKVNHGELNVIIFDVGQGDSIFIKTPKGRQILIDGGPDGKILDKLSDSMIYGDKYIDTIILTHPHADHLTGLNSVLKNYKVGEVWITGVVHTSATYMEFLDLMQNNNITARKLYSCGNNQELGIKNYELGDEFSDCVDLITIEERIKLRTLWPLEDLSGQKVDNLNLSSIVLKLETPGDDFLFMGDAEIPVEEEMLEVFGPEILKSDILKVGHHGGTDASSEEFISFVTPREAVISVGRDNDYGHPSLRVMRRLERMGVKVRRTDEEGDIVIGF